ncbi:MAG TPA: mechanosensitive ion channel protein MscS [Leptospiraceae bacterium]|nr:mechanosensitive ion channel protein MscS [Spirochaetaceae bacterium]HBS04508.1 mechanosensitive ion channel protein MscS [Leptospiraceae bacterium]
MSQQNEKAISEWVRGWIPDWLQSFQFLDIELWQWIGMPLAIALALGLAFLIGGLIIKVLRKLSSKTEISWDDQLIDQMKGPFRFFFFILIQFISFRLLFLHPSVQDVVDRVLLITLVIALGWAGQRVIGFLSMLALMAASREDIHRSRGIRTRVAVFRRIGGIFIVVFCAALILMQFDVVRKIGVSLLASAGIAGIMIGFAAQRSIQSLVAGLQIAITQPIRLGDVVIVEGQYGTVEEIQLTFVVVRTWDLRRLILPVGDILHSSFENWTRSSSDLLGTVEVHADYSVPVDEVRKALLEFVKGCENWDGKAAGLQVTQATDRTIVLRALISSTDSAKLWDLRCQVREWLVGYMQKEQSGKFLPQIRLDNSYCRDPGPGG